MKSIKESVLVKQSRLRARMTQDEVADALGYCSAQLISNIERGISSLPNDKVVPFCRATKSSVRVFLNLKVRAAVKELRKEIVG